MTRHADDRPWTARDAFERVRSGADARLALGDFLHYWRGAPAEERAALVAEPIEDPGSDLRLRRWAAFFTAAVEHLCGLYQVSTPSWSSGVSHRLEEPWYFEGDASKRRQLLSATPLSFRLRNVFCWENPLGPRLTDAGVDDAR